MSLTMSSGLEDRLVHRVLLFIADVKANFSRQYYITMTVHQMAVVLHFNSVEKCTAEDLKTVTQLSGEVLQKNLKSLVECGLLRCEKVRRALLLCLSGNEPSFSDRRTQ